MVIGKSSTYWLDSKIILSDEATYLWLKHVHPQAHCGQKFVDLSNSAELVEAIDE